VAIAPPRGTGDLTRRPLTVPPNLPKPKKGRRFPPRWTNSGKEYFVMARTVWDQDTMSTGLADIDAEHKQLISWMDDLIDLMKEGKGRTQIETLLDKLQGYTGTHFAHEEKCMAQYQCPVAGANVLAHKKFVAMVANLRKEYETDGATSLLVMDLQHELLNWFTAHIRGTDTQLGPCVRRAA
jgi:hemerythrin